MALIDFSQFFIKEYLNNEEKINLKFFFNIFRFMLNYFQIFKIIALKIALVNTKLDMYKYFENKVLI